MLSSTAECVGMEAIATNIHFGNDGTPQHQDNSESGAMLTQGSLGTTIKPHRKLTPTPILTTQLSDNRSAPAPIDITAESLNGESVNEPEGECKSEQGQKKVRRSRAKFAEEWAAQTQRSAPEPMDMATESLNGKGKKESAGECTSEQGQTKVRRSRAKFAEEWATQTTRDSNQKEGDEKGTAKRPPRKFTPQLLETARRYHRAGDKMSKNNADPQTRDGQQGGRRTRWSPPPPPDNTPTVDMSHNPLFLEIQRATSPTTRRRPSWASLRSRHSFVVPDLDPIESSESEPTSPVSPYMVYSANPHRARPNSEATRSRESVDDKFSGYLLELAAKAAEKQLREQAMAAFPNDDHHESVDHFIDCDADDLEVLKDYSRARRESSTPENNSELLAMQRHREKLEKQREAEREKKRRLEARVNALDHIDNSWGNAAMVLETSAANDLMDGVQDNGELGPMRNSARPPMLGDDLEFPRCPSPEPARFDSTQGCDAIRLTAEYFNGCEKAAEKGESLWCGNSNSSDRLSFYSRPNSTANSRSPSQSQGGLWGGCCAKSGLTPPRGPTGLLTPRIEIDSIRSPCPTPAVKHLLPPTPPPSNADFACIDEKLAAEAAIEEDFGDDFVTQVYNYLSLGYPSIARMFDEELSKISNIPVSELRQDDHLPTTRGYIRLGEDGYLADADITEESCMRWRALRIYVKEWARQHPNMATENTGPGAGTAVRKGSWAV